MSFNTPKPKNSWTWIALSSTAISALGLLAGLFYLLEPIGILLGLFLIGLLAGIVAGRQAWLSGVIVGLPFSLQQLTRHAMTEAPSIASLADPQGAPLAAVLMQPDYWRIAVPVAFVASSIAVMGGLAGAWVRTIRHTS